MVIYFAIPGRFWSSEGEIVITAVTAVVVSGLCIVFLSVRSVGLVLEIVVSRRHSWLKKRFYTSSLEHIYTPIKTFVSLRFNPLGL